MPIEEPDNAAKKTGERKKIRPTSASANIQTHKSYRSALIDKPAAGRPATAAPGSVVVPSRAPAIEPKKTNVIPKAHHWKNDEERELVEAAKNQRRMSLANVDNLDQADLSRPGATQQSAGALLKNKIEEKINIDTLELLKQAFEEADEDGSGELDLDEFKILLKSKLSLSGTKDQQIDALFYKIDWSSDGQITWDEFCTYMQLEYAEKEDSYIRSKEVCFHLPAKVAKSMPHRDTLLKITDTNDGTFIACSQEGLVSFWTTSLDMKRTRSVTSMDNFSKNKNKWITDFVIMSQYTKIIVGTGDREIQFYELSSFEPYCQISGLETVPLRMDYCSTGVDECLVMYGDSQGVINILVIKSAGECLRTWKKMPKIDGIANIGLDAVANSPNTKFIRWKVHGDWVQELKYYEEIRQVISCSNHANTALVIGCTQGSTHVEAQLKEIKDQKDGIKEPVPKGKNFAYTVAKPRLEADESRFRVYKGVKTFAYSKDKNIIVTGGMDRIVRMWNPYVSSKPTGMLRGHNAPIFYLFIAEEENRIFSISTDKCVKIWDIQDQNCLLTVRPKGHKIRGELQACHYSNVSKALMVATDQLSVLPLKLKPVLHADIVITHKEPIHAAKYNPAFKQVITCSDGSVVKIWDFESGNAVFDYGDAHGDSEITCMDFDTTGRRLITGARDGAVKIWNYNNGHCLKTLQKATKRDHGNEEISSIVYVEMNKNRYVCAVGWDRRINIYIDSNEESISHIQHPQDEWEDDLRNGHQEDIMSVTHSAPNLLATSSYDGEVIIWNLVSGHIFSHLRSPLQTGTKSEILDGEMSINKILFLKTRAYNKDAGSLVASGPKSYIHLWNVFQGGNLIAKWPATKIENAMVTTMVLNKTNTRLITGDSHGFINVWNIDGYGLVHEEKHPPELDASWRGHVESVTCMDYIDEVKMLLSSSLDCTVRLWTVQGHYVGTFGQPEPWDVYNPATFQHPMVPYDVLIDPMSMPRHPVIEQKINSYDVIHADSARNSDDDEEAPPPVKPVPFNNNQVEYVDDDTIAQQIKEREFNKGKGKRLRHEKLKVGRVDRGGPSEYQLLRCYDLDETPHPPAPPTLKANRDDPFDFYDD